MAKATSTSRKIVFGIALLFFIVYTAYILFFFVYAILIALKEDMIAFTMDQLQSNLFSLPEKANWKNFINAFEEWNKTAKAPIYYEAQSCQVPRKETCFSVFVCVLHEI